MCSSLKVNRRFGRIFLLQIQDLRINEARNQYETSSKQSSCFLFYLLFNPGDEGEMLLRNVRLFSTDYTVLHPSR
jgi:hypothetical protein